MISRMKCHAASCACMRAGQLMIEILVGLGVITTALVMSLTVITHATKLAMASRNKLEATKYIEKVLEAYRNTRDLDKETFFASETCNDPCGTFGINDMYSCQMTCTFSPAGASTRVDVTVTMSWIVGSDTVSSSIPTVLTLYDL